MTPTLTTDADPAAPVLPCPACGGLIGDFYRAPELRDIVLCEACGVLCEVGPDLVLYRAPARVYDDPMVAVIRDVALRRIAAGTRR